MREHLFYLLTVFIFSLLGIKALFHPGLFTAHDIWHQVVRLHYYYQAINDGQLPPYWVGQLANSFGYPLFNFSYHLPWIIGGLFMRLGIDFSTSLKFLFILSYLLSGITMYLFVYYLLKDKLSALLSSILYLWLPYHFLIIFVGASMGVAFVFVFLPVIFLGLHLLTTKPRIGIGILGIGLTGIILSHIMHLIFILPALLVFFFWEFINIKSKISFLRNIILSLILAILISSFYLIPALIYSQYTRVHLEDGIAKLYERNFITFNQLLYSKWGFSPIVNNAKNGEISFQLGIAQWISIIILFLLIPFKKFISSGRSLVIFLFIGFIFNLFLMLDVSSPLWKFLVKFITLDFPFRLLLPITFITSICAGIILTNLPQKLKIITLIFLISIAIYTNRNYINVNQYTDFPISTYLDLESEVTTNTFNEYLPIKANPKLLGKPWNEIVGEKLSVSSVNQTTNTLSFDVSSSTEQSVSLGQFYFPGQNLFVNGQLSKLDIDKEGRMSFTLPTGNHHIVIKYQETLLIKISKSLTIVGILITFFLFSSSLRKKATFN